MNDTTVNLENSEETTELDRSKLVDSFINGLASGPNAIGVVAQQLGENSEDAFAKEIRIIVDYLKRRMIFWDNGSGMTKDVEIKKFFSIHVPDTSRPKIGVNNSGRISTLAIAKSMRVVTVSKETLRNGEAYEIKFDRKTVEIIFKGGTKISNLYSTIKLEDSDLKEYLPSTGTVTILEDIDEKFLRSEEEILKMLSVRLLPNVAKKVLLNGQTVPKRPTLGKPITVHQKHPTLGKIDVELFISPEPNAGGIQIAGKGTIFHSFEDFVEKTFPNVYRPAIPSHLFYRNVGGYIAVEKLNEYRPHGSSTLRDDFVGSQDMKDLLEFLDTVVGKQLKELFDKLNNTKERQKRTGTSNYIIERINAVFPITGTEMMALKRSENEDVNAGFKVNKAASQIDPPATVDLEELKLLHVSKKSIELYPNEEVSIQVTKLIFTSGEFEWTCSKDAGVVVKKDPKGIKVVFKAGVKPGDYALVVKDIHQDMKAEILISIVDEKQLKISPRKIEIAVGNSQIFSLKNYDDKETYTWSVEPPHVGMVLSHKTGPETELSVTHEADAGDYKVTAVSNEGKTVSAQVRIPVVQENSNLIRFEDQYYIWTAIYIKGMDMVQLQNTEQRVNGVYMPLIEVNFAHSLIKSIEDQSAVYQAILPCLLITHLEFRAQNVKIDYSMITRKFNELYQSLLISPS
ncbi:MAG: ATP-binding protein [Candidatus Gracilibacteria bacterium]